MDDQPQAGPHVNIPPNSKPMVIFNLFLDVLFQQILNWTDANAAKTHTENPEKHKRKWMDTTVEEICALCLVKQEPGRTDQNQAATDQNPGGTHQSMQSSVLHG